MTQEYQQKLASQLAIVQAEQGVKGFVARILKALKAKNLTLSKLLRMYEAVRACMLEIENIAKEK